MICSMVVFIGSPGWACTGSDARLMLQKAVNAGF